MGQTLSMPIDVLPSLLLSSCYAVGILFLAIYRKEIASRFVGACVRFLAVGALGWGGVGLLGLHAPHGLRLLLPLGLLVAVGAVELTLRLAQVPVPRGYAVFYVGAMLLAGLSRWILPPYELQHPLRGADWALAAGVAVGWAFALIVAVRAAAMHRRYALVGVAVGLSLAVLLALHNGEWLPGHADGGPWGWGAGLAAWLYVMVTARHRQIQGSTPLLGDSTGLVYLEAMLAQAPVGVLHGEFAEFQALKDRYGAHMADQLAYRVSRELEGISRHNDRVVWLGGGQFLLIFPGIAFEHKYAVRDRVAQVVRQLQLTSGAGATPIPVTVHLGWSWGEAGASFEHVLSEANRAMQEEKSRQLRIQAGSR